MHSKSKPIRVMVACRDVLNVAKYSTVGLAKHAFFFNRSAALRC